MRVQRRRVKEMTKEKLMQVKDFYYAVQKMSDKEAMDAKNENN